jgi:hypothetical protein
MPTLLTLIRIGPWVAILLLLGVTSYQSGKIHDWHQKADHCNQLRASDRASYEQAQKDAAAQNKAHVAQIEHQYQENSDAARRVYQSDLARLHSLGVRQQGTAAPQSPAHGAGSPQVPAAPGGVDGAAQVCVPAADAMSSAETELRLYGLQSWISEQLKVRP